MVKHITILLLLFLYTTRVVYTEELPPTLPKRSLNVLFYIPTFPKATHSTIINQMLSFIQHGHRIAILTHSKSTTTYSDADAQYKKDTLTILDEINHYNLLNYVIYDEPPQDQRTFDIILCQLGHWAPFLLKYMNLKQITGKVITFFRGSDISGQVLLHPQLYDELFTKGTLFIPVCTNFKQKLIELGCPAEKIIVIHSAIDCKKFIFKPRTLKADETIKIITVGRLIAKKGTEYAIQAIADLLQKYPSLEFTIVGDGIFHKRLQELIQLLGAADKIKLIGWHTQEEIIALLDKAHIFVLPSITNRFGDQEGIPNALKEAMAMGLPVISTYHSGITELIEHEKSGFLVPEKDYAALAKELEYLITHPTTWEALGKAGRECVEQQFSMDQENEKLIKLCEHIADYKL